MGKVVKRGNGVPQCEECVCRKKVGTRKDSKTRGKSEVYILRCLMRKQTLEVSESLGRDWLFWEWESSLVERWDRCGERVWQSVAASAAMASNPEPSSSNDQ
jgi:hypothetical protein